jgi:NAD(P)-dependent dehydrogenase (short-subunit alcohol dehydrogenase family)
MFVLPARRENTDHLGAPVMGKFKDKVVAITGGNSGIGLETAIAFKNEGARVAILGRDTETLRQAAQNHGFLTHAGDVTQASDLEEFFGAVRSELGAIDALFANAGVAEFFPFEGAPMDHFDRVFNINVKGVFNTVQMALPALNTPASIILTTSVANTLGEPNTSVYAASKAAISSFARTLSTELLPKGVRVNCISPGPTDTPVFDRMGMDPTTLASTKEFIANRLPIGRMGQPSDIAKAVLFLASDDSSFVVGTEVVADGGFSNCALMPG